MKVAHLNSNGEIIAYVLDRQLYFADLVDNVDLTKITINTIDEDAINRNLLLDFIANFGKFDVNGLGKYYWDLDQNRYRKRQGWQVYKHNDPEDDPIFIAPYTGENP